MQKITDSRKHIPLKCCRVENPDASKCLSFFVFIFFLVSIRSAMNMDRFERGPREILNPEIQKVG